MLYRHKDLTKASKIVLQPHSSEFLKMSNHQAVMETELRHYSAITRGKSSNTCDLSCLCVGSSVTLSEFYYRPSSCGCWCMHTRPLHNNSALVMDTR